MRDIQHKHPSMSEKETEKTTQTRNENKTYNKKIPLIKKNLIEKN